MTRLLPPHQNQNLDSIFFDENEFYKPRIPLQNTESKETISSGHETISSQPKTVRCVIQKDFEDGLKKFERSEEKVKKIKTQEQWVPDQSEIDKIRLQNHLKWKKQKEEEYTLKKEAEKLGLQKKREEEIQLEKIKKQKEKEKEEKIREWQEQKAREKEERRREEIIMKELEDELRKNPQKLDKDKLLEEWVKLKNRQKQLECEKKAQMQRKVEESKAIRQALAEISYQQWKEKAKAKLTSLPKNGYQIFGPKPTPVVKEDWNNDFINGDSDEKSVPLRPSKSTISTFRQYSKSANDDYLNIGRKTPSNHQIKNTKSGTDVKNLDSNFESLRKLWAINSDFPAPNIKNQPVIKPARIVQSIPNKESHLVKKFENKTGIKYPQESKLKGWGDSKFSPSILNVLPNKKKMDLYLNGTSNNKSDSDSEKNDLSITHRIGESFPTQKKPLNIPNFSQLFHKRNFSSDGESPDEKSNRRSRSHDKSSKQSSTPAPRVSSMPRTGPQTQEELPAPRRGISQSMTSLARANVLSKQQPKIAPKSFKGTRRRSKPRVHKSPIKEERNRWKAKKSQVVAKKKLNSDSESENLKKLESKETAPVKNYLDDYLAIHILSSDDDGKDCYAKTYPLGPSRIQSVRNRVLKISQSKTEPKE